MAVVLLHIPLMLSLSRALPTTLGNLILLFEELFISLQKALSFFAHIDYAMSSEIIEFLLPLHTLSAYLNVYLVCIIKS